MEDYWNLLLDKINETRLENGMWKLNEYESSVIRSWVEEFFDRQAYYELMRDGEAIADVMNGEINFLHLTIENEENLKKHRRKKLFDFLLGCFIFIVLILLTIGYALATELIWLSVLSGISAFAFLTIFLYRYVF